MEPSDRAFRLARRSVLPAAALAALPTRIALAQTTPPAPVPGVDAALKQLDAIVWQSMQRTGVPGVAVAVVYRDRPVYLKGFGIRQVGTPDPVIDTAPGGGLVLTQGPRLLAFPLRHFDRHVFSYQPAGENAYGRSAVAFTIGAGRKATAVRIENLDTDHQGMFKRHAAE